MQALNPFFRPKNRPYRTETLFPIPCYNRAMKNSEVRTVPVAAVCDCRRMNSNHPAYWSVAAFVRKPQIEPVTPTLHSPRLSTAALAKEDHSSLIKPNQAISCLDAIQPHPPYCSKIATSPIRLRQTPACRAVLPRRLVAPMPCEGGSEAKAGQSQSKPVKVFPNRYLRAIAPAATTIYCGLPGHMHNQWWLPSSSDITLPPIRNPQSAIAEAHLLQRYSFTQIKPDKGE